VKPARWTNCLIESKTTRSFWRNFDALPANVRRHAKQAYALFRNNPSHPSLHFKKLEGEQDIYSVRVGLNYRALGVMKGDRVVWYWIGDHREYDRIA
jgi:hypothetical protein